MDQFEAPHAPASETTPFDNGANRRADYILTDVMNPTAPITRRSPDRWGHCQRRCRMRRGLKESLFWRCSRSRLHFEVAGDQTQRRPGVARVYCDHASIADVRGSRDRHTSGNSGFPGPHAPFVLTQSRSKSGTATAHFIVPPVLASKNSWHGTASG
jgi:hypothetical protein